MTNEQTKPIEFAIRAARIFEPADGSVVQNGAVVVNDSKIVGVVDSPPSRIPVLDLGNRTLMPGLVDTHTHMVLRPENQVWPPAILWKTQALKAVEGVAAARTALTIGFTTIRDTDNEGAWHADIALRDAINNGVIPGPRMYVASDGISITGGDMTLMPGVNRELGIENGAYMADTRDKMIAAVRHQVNLGTDWVKVYGTGTRRHVDRKTFAALQQFNLEEMSLMVNEARRFRKDVIVHTYGGESALAAAQAGARSVEHGVFFDESVLKALVEHKTFWCPTLDTYYKRQHTEFDKELVRRHKKAFQVGLSMGVKIIYGTDIGSYPHGLQMDEFSLMVSYGMKPLDAIRAGTTVAAELLRMEGQIGTLKSGAFADLVVLDGDPTSDINKLKTVCFVMKEGRVFRDDAGAAQKFPEYRWTPSSHDK